MNIDIPEEHAGTHEPPHNSCPPGQVQAPFVQTRSTGQSPHEPVQPSGPQVLPAQLATQTQLPF
jgi:hypothetical protein